MQTNQKGITPLKIIILIAIFATAVAAGAYFYVIRLTPQEEPGQIAPPYHLKTGGRIETDTANWQTYKNDQYGFEIKYPEGFTAEEAKITDRLSGTITRKEIAFYAPGEQKGEEAAALALIIDKEPATYAFHGTWASVPYSSAGNEKILRSEKVVVNGVSFTKDYWTNAISAHAGKDHGLPWYLCLLQNLLLRHW